MLSGDAEACLNEIAGNIVCRFDHGPAYWPDHFLMAAGAPAAYFHQRRQPKPGQAIRYVIDRNGEGGMCSTTCAHVGVTLPAISMIERKEVSHVLH